ncbi:translation initiation factor-like protein eif-2b subunit alpha [Microdochium trichocladiopsis]|uniref:Translation initiation factor eIF2B subunit alpha n=1 Tax=Microdochium trichocladiopsis TaxID=1682393 RepID=A0A9P8Y7E2_9PEZI|nr:translation initiation factor-like protein eif-2b subunit alpha [Microdochium trichocladiopsis]KAH7031317.1 translation initiation factor-like protein eif-2b subunit alpha [Microdochium trichocladiopsis]
MAAAVATLDASATTDLAVRSKPDSDEAFDIVKVYHRLLADDPDLTMPVAAIEALIETLGHSRSSTVFETMDLVKTQSAKLLASVANPIPLSHGTDLFQQYLVMSLKQDPSSKSPDSIPLSPHENFEEVRQHLLRNGRLFASRAKESREKIASLGRRFIANDSVVLTHGGSRVVGTLLGRAAEQSGSDAPRRFKVIHVINEAEATESNRVVAALRAKGVPVATIPDSAVAYAMSKVSMVVVGAEAVTSNGGIISRLGTYQIALLAKAAQKDFFVAGEQHKFGKTFPLDQFDIGFEQNLLDFHASKAHEDTEERAKQDTKPTAEPVDYTPPELITSFFADHGVLAPSAVSKEILDFLM